MDIILKIKPLVISALSIFVLSGCVTAEATYKGHEKLGAEYAKNVNWHTLKEGSTIALAEKKPCLVDFAVPEHCARCEFLQNNVYNRKEITDKINSDFIPIWIDLSKELTPEEKALGEKFDYRNDCLLLFLDHKGNIIKDPEGKKMCFVDKIPPQVFIDHLDYVREKYIVQ
jgi:thioredoxin-related protein